jgi:hypothetical protein
MPSRTPNLFLVGAPRCGTTALYTYLRAHPDVFMSPVKEPHYFSTDLFQPPPQIPIADESAYLHLFAGATDETWLGEASPYYFYSAVAPSAIEAFSPDARVVITLRNPADLMYSSYCHGVRAALFHDAQETAPSFERALAEGPARLRGESLPAGAPAEPGRCLYLCYRELGRLAERVERIMHRFGRDRVHTVVFDDLSSDAPTAYDAICRFLDIDPSPRPSFDLSAAQRAAAVRPRSPRLARLLWRPGRSSAAAARMLLPARARSAVRDMLQRWNDRPPPAMEPSTRRRILDECATDVRRLGELIGRNLDHWVTDEPAISKRS